ncbi:hypothetical protein [Geminisphaera colitermitum]|uniref:hypothetical protein n=1 Tax=Geminisphaera colitermitum TaxID=1148786 RepID=UPI000158CDC0|nr:hypothetical protein [Geminisphaera colitermitum]
MAYIVGTVRPYEKQDRPTLISEDRFITDNEQNGVGSTRYADFQIQQDARYLQKTQRNAANGVAGLAADGLLDPSVMRAALAPEQVADNTALAGLTVVQGDIGRRLVRVQSTGISYIAKATGTGLDRWQVYDTIPTASQTAAGIVQLATNAEVTAGTNTTKAVTPAQLSQAASRVVAGRVAVPVGSDSVVITFPTAFAAAPVIVISVEGPDDGDFWLGRIHSRSATGFTVTITGAPESEGYFVHYHATPATA